MKYALSFSDNTLILISESISLLIKIAERQWILINEYSSCYKYCTANQWIHWFQFIANSIGRTQCALVHI